MPAWVHAEPTVCPPGAAHALALAFTAPRRTTATARPWQDLRNRISQDMVAFAAAVPPSTRMLCLHGERDTTIPYQARRLIVAGRR